nr:MAG TPA: hypothetical protein [Bacteriophage sp.]
MGPLRILFDSWKFMDRLHSQSFFSSPNQKSSIFFRYR